MFLFKQEEHKDVSSRIATALPSNASNPYDEAGWLYTELFDTYFTNGDLGGSVSQIASKVQSIANANSRFNAIKSAPYHAIDTVQVNYILDHPTTCVSDVISASSMSTIAKSSLTSFVNSFVALMDEEYDCEVLYQSVVSYETIVIKDSLLTTSDKRIILTTTSIARHSAYRALKKPKKNTDPDWVIFIGNVIAATDGAEYGMAESVTEALVTGIAQN